MMALSLGRLEVKLHFFFDVFDGFDDVLFFIRIC